MVAVACLGCFVLSLSAALVAGYRVWIREPAPVPAHGERPAFEDRPPKVPSLHGPLALIERIGALIPIAEERRLRARQKLISAGYRPAAVVSVYFGLKACLGVVVPAALSPLLYAIRPDVLAVAFAALLAAFTAFRIPSWFVGFSARARQEKIRNALPDLIDLLVVGVDSGLSVDQAIEEAARGLHRAHPELAEELYIYDLHVRAGTERAGALRNLARRTAVLDMRHFTSLLIQTERFGTGISRMLRTQARLMRSRRGQWAEEQARKLSIKIIFPVFFLILPSTFLVTAGPAVLYLFGGLHKMLGTE